MAGKRKTFTVQIAQMVREYANVEIRAENELDAIHKAYDVEWDDLLNEDKIRLDYDYTETLQPIVIKEQD